MTVGDTTHNEAAPTRKELIAHLVAARVAGDVATPRGNSLDHMRRLAAADPDYLLGLDFDARWTYERVVELMAERSGAPADPTDLTGPDYIDPERTAAALDRMADRLRRAARTGEAVLLATGHPGGLLGTHLAIARLLADAGAELVVVPAGIGTGDADVRQVGGVAVLQQSQNLLHTHSPQWMEAVLDRMTGLGMRPPDLVVADHGWAGCAAQRGIDTVSFADCNDPALFVAEADGVVLVTVPLEDGLAYSYYEPMNAYLTARSAEEPVRASPR